MPRRIIQTTRRIRYNQDGEPVETVVSSAQESPAPSGAEVAQSTEVYEPQRALQRTSYTYVSPPQPTRVTTEVVDSQGWAHALRSIADRQMQILREFDLRIGHLEDNDRRALSSLSFERATWWALWGILMLILGAALVVILMLIVTGLAR